MHNLACLLLTLPGCNAGHTLDLPLKSQMEAVYVMSFRLACYDHWL
jgi:hypothetical protein